MESYEILYEAIPRGKSKIVAKLLSVSAAYVRRWRTEPESDDSPTANGQQSILDRICDLIDAVFLVNPKGVSLIIEYINNHYRNLIETHSETINCHQSRATHCAELLKETTEAVNKLNLDGCNDETLRELIEMRDAADRAILSVQKTLKGKK